MSKHQACNNCTSSFVGPDTGIGDNLCPVCDEAIHGTCNERIAELEAANKRLQAVVDCCAECVPVDESLEVEVNRLKQTIAAMQVGRKSPHLASWAEKTLLQLAADEHRQKELEAQNTRLHSLADKLGAVMDAAGAFLAMPPEGMGDHVPFGQRTRAGDCRALNKACREAVKEIAQTGCRRCSDCPESSHHWLPVCQPQHDYGCKHCDAIGKECPECFGEGCRNCGGEGVLLMGERDAEAP